MDRNEFASNEKRKHVVYCYQCQGTKGSCDCRGNPILTVSVPINLDIDINDVFTANAVATIPNPHGPFDVWHLPDEDREGILRQEDEQT